MTHFPSSYDDSGNPFRPVPTTPNRDQEGPDHLNPWSLLHNIVLGWSGGGSTLSKRGAILGAVIGAGIGGVARSPGEIGAS